MGSNNGLVGQEGQTEPGPTAAKAAFMSSDVWEYNYPIIFSENIFVATIDLLFMVLWSGVKMTDTET
ncbi:MAG: hypothetical protein ABI191_02735 [Rhizomicrobium sp.]